MYVRLLRPLRLRPLYSALVSVALFFVSFAPFVAMYSLRWIERGRAFDLFVEICFVVMVFTVYLFLYILTRDIAYYLWRILRGFKRLFINNKSPKESPQAESAVTRREFLFNVSSLTMLGAAAITTPVSFYHAKHNWVLRRETLFIPTLPKHLDGFKIAHLSDIHASSTITRKYVDAIVQDCNKLNPDMVALTGDLADGFPEVIGPELEPLTKLKSKYGAYYCCGNHENMWDGEGWRKVVESYGVHVFRNEHVILQNVAGGALAIAGVIDHRGDRKYKIKSSPEQALKSVPKDIYTIMLVHQPKSVNPSIENGADLVLVGHTHGGQVFPLTLLMPYIHEYNHGVYKRDQSYINVSCGTGYWGPPMRLGMSAEIVEITLRRASEHA